MVSRKYLNVTLYCSVIFSFRPAFRPRDTNMYLIQDYVQNLHGVASLPWTSFISLFKSRRCLRKSIILHLLHNHILCSIKSFPSCQAYQYSVSLFVTKSLRLNREQEKNTSWYSRDFRFEFRRQDRETSPGFSYFFLIHPRKYYEARSEIIVSYFIMLAHTSEADVGDMAVEGEPSRQYSLKFCCRVTDDSRRTV